VSNKALLHTTASGGTGALVFDVWEREPAPRLDLLARVDLATPHIAGYSFDGKVTGTIMLYQRLVEAFGLDGAWDFESVLVPGPGDRPALSAPDASLPEPVWMDALIREMYDIRADDRRMKRLLDDEIADKPGYFSDLRRRYPRRRTFARHELAEESVPEGLRDSVYRGLGVSRC
jgi:erythronate-4-phosphate dehydrogenase